MTEQKPKRPGPLGFRPTRKVSARIKRDATRLNMSVGAYINYRLSQPAAPAKSGQTQDEVLVLLAKVLAAIGASRLPQNINQLAKAANQGCLQCLPETDAFLQEACREITDISKAIRAIIDRKGGEI